MKLKLHMYHWSIVSRNNKIVCHSEQYKTPAKAKQSAHHWANYFLLPVVNSTARAAHESRVLKRK